MGGPKSNNALIMTDNIMHTQCIKCLNESKNLNKICSRFMRRNNSSNKCGDCGHSLDNHIVSAKVSNTLLHRNTRKNNINTPILGTSTNKPLTFLTITEGFENQNESIKRKAIQALQDYMYIIPTTTTNTYTSTFSLPALKKIYGTIYMDIKNHSTHGGFKSHKKRTRRHKKN